MAQKYHEMDTAPKDGSHILVCVADGYWVEAWWDKEQTNFYKSQEGWASYDPANMQGDWVSHFSDHGTKDARLYCGSTPEYWIPKPETREALTALEEEK